MCNPSAECADSRKSCLDPFVRGYTVELIVRIWSKSARLLACPAISPRPVSQENCRYSPNAIFSGQWEDLEWWVSFRAFCLRMSWQIRHRENHDSIIICFVFSVFCIQAILLAKKKKEKTPHLSYLYWLYTWSSPAFTDNTWYIGSSRTQCIYCCASCFPYIQNTRPTSHTLRS